MDNINVLVFVESRYKANRKGIAAAVSKILKEHSVTGLVEVSVAIVGDRKMRELNKKYREKDETTNVLSFSLSEGEPSVLPPNLTLDEAKILRLGDIVISYPQIIKEASEEEILVDDKINELVEHGTLHLLGIHHEE